eukprot:TRINITY_DN10931_c0_g1_i2.p2 TRINITY_DN10931_c0_g1~~TRINITY_DN10931_c0_g1_i2.p2  ORF type:complete len:121 (-),score=35.55 TRINITY_DN10931_c0_g1_i2:81-443(-)
MNISIFRRQGSFTGGGAAQLREIVQEKVIPAVRAVAAAKAAVHEARAKEHVKEEARTFLAAARKTKPANKKPATSKSVSKKPAAMKAMKTIKKKPAAMKAIMKSINKKPASVKSMKTATK